MPGKFDLIQGADIKGDYKPATCLINAGKISGQKKLGQVSVNMILSSF